MAPDTHAPVAGPVLEHCPQCRGAVRPGAPWCTQCWTDLRPAPVAAREPEPQPSPPVAPRPSGEQDAPAATRPGWPCSACGGVNALELDACAACGTPLFASLRAGEEPLLVVPGLGDITRLSRAQRLAAATAVAVGFALLVLLVGLLFG